MTHTFGLKFELIYTKLYRYVCIGIFQYGVVERHGKRGLRGKKIEAWQSNALRYNPEAIFIIIYSFLSFFLSFPLLLFILFQYHLFLLFRENKKETPWIPQHGNFKPQTLKSEMIAQYPSYPSSFFFILLHYFLFLFLFLVIIEYMCKSEFSLHEKIWCNSRVGFLKKN